METIKHYFDLTNQLSSNVECEARIKAPFVNYDSLQKLISKYPFTENKYQEFSKRQDKSTYRLRQGDVFECICKTSLFYKHHKELWFTIHISSEVEIPYSRDLFMGIENIEVSRWTLNLNQCKVEIGFNKNNSWLEVEKLPESTPENFLSTIEKLLKTLQDSELIATYSDYLAVERLNIQYAKPITLTDPIDLFKCKWITPKYDGIRVFIIIRYGRVLMVDLKGNVKRLNDITKRNDPIIILDCEKVKEDIYIIDVYDLSLTTDIRFNKRNEYKDWFKIKPVYRFLSIDQVIDLVNNTEVITDGIIVMGDEYNNNIYKWKPVNTIDLVYKDYDLFTSDNKKLGTCNYRLENNKIYEFTYESNNFIPIKERLDKPYANSYKVCLSNINSKLNQDFFLGVGCYFMRKYHNEIKLQLLTKVQPSILLDIGTGQGGDLSKWKKVNIKKVVCIEPSMDAYRESVKRGNTNLTINKRIKEITPETIPVEPDVISAFFCLNLFDNDDIISLLEIIKKKKPKYFIGICLTTPKNISNECFSLHGSKNYTLSIHKTRILNVKERIVDLARLNTILESLGYFLEQSNKLNSGVYLSRNERELSSMYEAFIFKKVI